jgi:hypothetical protein
MGGCASSARRRPGCNEIRGPPRAAVSPSAGRPATGSRRAA